MSLKDEALFISALKNAKSNSPECIQVYDLKTAACLKGFRGLSPGYSTLNVFGDYVMASQKDRSFLQAWLINKNAAMDKKFPIPNKANVVAISSDAPHYCIVGIDEKIHVYGLLPGRHISVINRHYQTVSCLKFLNDSQCFASAGHDGFVYLWSMASIHANFHANDTIKPHYILGQHCDKVTGIDTNDCGLAGGKLVSCSLDFTLKVYCLETGVLIHNIITSLALTCVTLSSIGSFAYLGSRSGKIMMMNLFPPPETRDVQRNDEGTPAHESAINCIEMNGKGDTVVTGGADGEVKLWYVGFEPPEKRRHFNKCNFHYMKSVVVGRGPITNLHISLMDFNNLTKTEEIHPCSIIRSFDNFSDTPITVMLPRPVVETEDLSAEIDAALLKGAFLKKELTNEVNKRNNKCVKVHNGVDNNNVEDRSDDSEEVKRLKRINKELYLYCLNKSKKSNR